MIKSTEKDLDYYIAKVKAHLLKKFPNLEFEIDKRSDREVAIYYRPYSEEDEYPIVHRIGNIATDALVESNIRIWVLPGI